MILPMDFIPLGVGFSLDDFGTLFVTVLPDALAV